jgi:ABC-type lipoprotein release transport system permease subunit
LGIFSTNLHEFIPAQAFLLAISASLLAAIYPAWRISRMQPAAALRGE